MQHGQRYEWKKWKSNYSFNLPSPQTQAFWEFQCSLKNISETKKDVHNNGESPSF